VVTVLQRAAAQGLDWKTAETLSDKELSARLYPQESGKAAYKMPTYVETTEGIKHKWTHKK